MQSIIFSAVLDGLAALYRGTGGLPNQLLRDVQAIHPNVTFADLPKELQDAIAESTRAAFTQLLKEGYAVGPKQAMQASRPLDRVPERERRGPGERRDNRVLNRLGQVGEGDVGVDRLDVAQQLVGQPARSFLQRRERVEDRGEDDGLHDVVGGSLHGSSAFALVDLGTAAP
jgi:hypothetical protein